MKTLGTFVITAALIVGLAGCAAATSTQYNLTISSTVGGEVTTPGEGAFTYEEGEVVSLVAEADEGYQFIDWTGDVGAIDDINSASISIIMSEDYEIIANFIGQYDLIISSTEGGSVTTPGEGTFSYDGGMVLNLMATPDSGYQFVNWAGNVHTIADVNAASITITMNDDYSLIANFAVIPPGQYTLTISSTEGGSVSTPGQGTFRCAAGAVVDLVTESEEGYKFFTWTGDIETMAAFNASSSTAHNQPPMHFSITMLGNYTITAHFIVRWAYPDMIDPEL